MAGVLAFQGYLRVLKDNGDVCSDAKAQWYIAGTTTPSDTYTANTLITANANPVEANALGIFPEMWLSPTVSYKVVITGTGVTTRTIDNVYGSLTINQLENDSRYIGVPGGAAYTTTGSSNAYVVSTSLSLAALASFTTFLIKPNFTNTGPATLNVDALGAKSIYSGGSALAGGEIVSGQIYEVSYNGTQFQLIGRYKKPLPQIFTSSGTYTPSPGMTACVVECIGAGAGGGGMAASAGGGQSAAGGGGGGGYSRKICTAADIGTSKAVTIGAAGAGGAAGNNNGIAGGDTSVGSLCIGKGGSPGIAGANGAGGAGGVAGTGDFSVPGQIGRAHV